MREGWIGGRRAMLGVAAMSACLAAALPSRADELGALTPLGPLRADVYWSPHEAAWEATRLRREVPPDTRIETAHRERELGIIQRDAEREVDRGLLGADFARGDEVFRELSMPDAALPGYAQDIDGRDRVIGTGLAFIRIGDLLGRAEALVPGGDITQARELANRARGLLASATRGKGAVWSGDPNVVVARERLRAVDAVTGG